MLKLERINVSDDGLAHLGKYCEALLKLKIVNLKRCTEAGIIGLCTGVGLQQLRSLSIFACTGITNQSLQEIGKHLDLSGRVDVTDETVMVILQGSGRKLVSLNLSGCIKILNVSIRAVAKYCGKHLKSLGLDGCCNVGDHSLQFVAAAFISLEELDASQTAITDYGVGSLVASCGPWLQTLTLSGCKFLTVTACHSLSSIVHFCGPSM
ncbi:unnamed protein product [Sphagnum compactum]